MDVHIRQENPADYPQVFEVVEAAFRGEAMSDKTEQFLVERLRKSTSFIEGLSIVGECEGEVVGHILLTKIQIKNEQESFESLALAPVSVKPDFQGKGIGGKLIRHAHECAKDLGFKSIVLLGHESYYPRFGYELTSQYNIELPFEAPEANCMVIELVENGLKGVSGVVEYDKAFFEAT
ncbi:MAG: GNAT family N-acetyltransferase [Chitinophagales bacterium]